MKKKFNIAIIGATGLVGSTTLSILEERKFPIDKIYFLASKKSAGDTISFQNHSYYIEDLGEFDFSKTELCFFCTSNEVSSTFIPKATAAGNIVIDKSSFYRYDKDVPLIVPEVNADALKDRHKKNIIANPNCSTIPIAVALKPIQDAVGLSRINIATYQSVSGTGKDAVSELAEQTTHLLSGQTVKPKIYPQQIAFNVLPHCDDFQENGYTKEEMKLVWELQKILKDPTLQINPTAVRVPVFYGHSAAVHLETKDKIAVSKVIDLLHQVDGLTVVTGHHPYATPVHDAAGNDDIYVGRIREDISHPNGLNFWIVCDNIRKGAALNAVQVAELLL